MSRRALVLEPDGWPCSIRDCPDGLFTWAEDVYLKQGDRAMWLDGVEFDPYPASPDKLRDMDVQPVRATWRDLDA